MNSWYIKLHRKSVENALYFLEPFTKRQARQDLLLIANSKEGTISVRGNIVRIKRWQVWHSETTLSNRRGRSRNKVRRFLNFLEKEGNVKQQKSRVMSLYTIVNYNKYQSDDTTDDTTERQQTIQQTDINNLSIYIWKYFFATEEELQKLYSLWWEKVCSEKIEAYNERITNKRKWKNNTSPYMTVRKRLNRDYSEEKLMSILKQQIESPEQFLNRYWKDCYQRIRGLLKKVLHSQIIDND